MSTSQPSASQKPLRLWPGIALFILLVIGRFIAPAIDANLLQYGVMGSVLCGFLIGLWWLFLSRAPWSDRLTAVGIVALSMAIATQMLHESIGTGMMGMMYGIYAIPLLASIFVVWAVATRNWERPARRASMAASIVVATFVWTLLRTDGFDSEMRNDFAWRWSETAEDRLVSSEATGSTGQPNDSSDLSNTSFWPGFRGTDRNSKLKNATIAADWKASPPLELWRQPVGPGWSSFAVQGNLVFTQEQRGESETVSCYNLQTGALVWKHEDDARFWEANAGAGPRGTPTLSDSQLYTLGATGILNALDASTGALLWTRNAADDTGAAIPGWGFAGSPLVVDNKVVVATAGTLAAYDRETGYSLWVGPEGGDGYSSPHLLTIDGVAQILLASRSGVTSVSASDGALLWEKPWPGGSRIVQPAVTSDGDILVSRGERSGLARFKVAREGGEWNVVEKWNTNRVKPYFSDFVVHGEHLYGFDGSNVICADVATGDRQWKGARYGSGQLLFLEDQELLIILSETGELALVSAKPDAFEELARIPAIEGKTWNHPVLVDNVLLVRNDREMAAFRLPKGSRK